MILDLGCGYLSDHKRRSGIGLDIQKGTCDILGDANNLPFKNNSFDFVYARNILEHLENPFNVLKELQRVIRYNGKVSITLPIHHNPCKDEILKFLAGFPLRVFYGTIRRLLRWRKNRFKKGFWHKNRLEPKHIAQFFKIVKIAYGYTGHPYNKLRKLKLIRQLIKSIIYYPFPHVVYVLGVNHD